MGEWDLRAFKHILKCNIQYYNITLFTSILEQYFRLYLSHLMNGGSLYTIFLV